MKIMEATQEQINAKNKYIMKLHNDLEEVTLAMYGKKSVPIQTAIVYWENIVAELKNNRDGFTEGDSNLSKKDRNILIDIISSAIEDMKDALKYSQNKKEKN